MVQWGPNSCAEDGYEDPGGTWNEGVDPLYCGQGYHAAWRFDNVTVGNGDTIDTPTEIVVNVLNEFGAVDDADMFGRTTALANITQGNRPSTWTRTTASTTWPSAPGTGTETVDVQAIVQEIVDGGTWASGDDMCFVLWHGNAAEVDYIELEGLANAGTSEATLEINYTAAGGGGIVATEQDGAPGVPAVQSKTTVRVFL